MHDERLPLHAERDMQRQLSRCDSGGIFKKLDCALMGQRCATDRCVDDTSQACTAGSVDRCDGADVVQCPFNMTARTKCGLAIANTSCQIASNNAFCGWSNACYYDTFTETCSGTMMTACMAGRIETFDCGAHGFTTCQTTSQGKARCI